MEQNKIFLIDGTKYCLWTPKDENELENSIRYHAKEIFGQDIIYFDVKKKIRTVTGEGTIPDGYMINFDEKTFYLIEVELSSHHEYDHISKQIGKFIAALKNYRSRQKIARVLKDYIEKDIVRKKFVMDKIGEVELYQFFLEDILENVKEQNYQTIVVIDKITDKITEACSILSQKPKILEFTTFIRENVGDLRVHCHLFESLVSSKKAKIQTQIEEEKYKTRHRSWGVKNEKHVYVNKITQTSGQMYRDHVPKEESIKIVNNIYNIGKKNREITRIEIAKVTYGDKPANNQYWWVDNTMGILVLEGLLQYLRGKNPQKFKTIDNFKPAEIINKIKKIPV